MKKILYRIFKPKIYKRYKSFHWWLHRKEEYDRRVASGEIEKDDILAYLYYHHEGPWDELIERFGKIKVRQYETLGYIKHYNKYGLLI